MLAFIVQRLLLAVLTIWVISADHIDGPWSDPVDLKLPHHIDPCHAVGEDGSRWLFLSGGDRIRLSEDGLSTVGKPEHTDMVVAALTDILRAPEARSVPSPSGRGLG